MGKLVFGIVAVAVLQVVFVGYTRLQEPLEVSVLPAQAEVLTENPSILWNEEPDVLAEAAAEPEVLIAQASQRRHRISLPSRIDEAGPMRPGPMRARVPSPAFSKFSPPKPARPDDFRTVVISYRAGAAGAPSPCDKVKKPAAVKKPFVADTNPSANRPWEVVTTFGSRSN